MNTTTHRQLNSAVTIEKEKMSVRIHHIKTVSKNINSVKHKF